MQSGLRVVTLQGAILKTLMIGWHHNYFVFGGSNKIFADCKYNDKIINNKNTK